MSVHVVATAGHVDHGKSTLVRALTGTDPDRWEEEHRRGLTIDLGYAWTTLDTGAEIAFVDVPGHRRFIGNMLAGLGPAPAVMMVVAADEGWRRQSAEHLAAIDALGLGTGLLVVTRSDLADPAPAIAQSRREIAASSLGDVEAVAVSARTGAGLDDLRAALARMVATLPAPKADRPVRLWIDRSFSVTGAGTVVTGTLGEGSIGAGDVLALAGPTGDTDRIFAVRGVQSLDRPRERVAGTARIAVNLRGIAASDIGRGDALVTPGRWRPTGEFDGLLTRASEVEPNTHLTLHVGTAAVPARVRPLAGDAVRVRLARPLLLAAGDRAILRDPSDDSGDAVFGVGVVDVAPPTFARRGDAARRGTRLSEGADAAEEHLARRGHLTVEEAGRLGLDPATDPRYRAGLLVTESRWREWCEGLLGAVRDQAARDPLDPSLSAQAARAAAQVPPEADLAALADAAGLDLVAGRVHQPGVAPDLGRAEAGLAAIEARLTAHPFQAPEQDDLDDAGLTTRHLAAAVALGRIVRLPGDIVLRPDAPARAMRELAALPQPFTTSQARQALGTSRRVAIPLLEHLDSRGWTRRLDAGHREVAR